MRLDVQEIRKSYVRRHATLEVLKGASLRVEAGESVAIVGKSGAGKSTLLHILGGIDHPESGCVAVDGVDVYGMSQYRRARLRAARIGFVFQAYHLLPEMDVLENVMLPAMALGLGGRGGRRERAMELLSAVGLESRSDHTPLELSGGEQQRVALARALMNDPELVLADEPTGNLDGSTGTMILDQLFSLIHQRRHSLVMVTHNETVAQLCDRVMVLRDGQIVPA